ncbi:MAG: chemotaxis protein CheA [Candidatus Desulfatibia sp.]|uniref:chemotaxis protein CheA n=1 Tax=Candidatus Desulfatibia sp. TaxID=3101189 RepID=UPI002F2C3E78
MSEMLEKISKNIESIALEVVMLDVQDIPALGKIVNCLGVLEEDSKEIDQPAFSELIQAIKSYIEKIILGEAADVTPLEEGVDSLQTILRHVSNQEEYGGDISQILDRLKFKKAEPDEAQRVQAVGTKEKEEDIQSPDEDLSEEDRAITLDFVMESLENLEAIEVSLIDLEEDSSDIDSLNTIFRTFHTIKGVSSFLNLQRINTLAHHAENLLDKARGGEIVLEGATVDIVFESMDALKKMIMGARQGIENRTSLDIGLDVAPLVNRIEELVSRADLIGDKPLGEILVQGGAVTPDDLAKGLERQKTEPGKKIGQILVEEKSAEPKAVASALREQKKFSSRQIDLQVKVDTKKLDNLVDMTGELVIAMSMLRQSQVILTAQDQKLERNLGQLAQITSGLQTTAMSMRMVPIKSTFQKMVRLIRDLSKNAGKQVQLEMTGEDTEIDRNVVDELYEPLVHMIRNSVDHGIEPPEERKKAGKNRKGKIHLRAYHQGGHIIVEIADDGRGLNKDRIIEKAKAGGMITEESEFTDSEIYNLIFQPGFSTAEKVTDVSGRGVGMDVVKKAMEKLRGRVEINTRPGEGTTFVISLPLTLAIIEGMLVRVGAERYIIPVFSVLESFRPTKEQYSTVEGKGEMLLSRGRLIPMVRLDRTFKVKGDAADPWESLVVIVEHEGRQMGLLLDELLGKEEVVIKSMGAAMQNINGIAGGAIMGDGRVGLILDMAGIWAIVQNN